MRHSSKSKDFIKAVYNGISYRKADPKKIIVRTDNGPQFKSKATNLSNRYNGSL